MISWRIISGCAGLIFAIFSPNESILGADDPPGLIFFDILGDVAMVNSSVKKMANSLLSSLRHSETEWNIASSMCTLTAQMMPGYRENFVKFGPVTPELTELICQRLVRHGQKSWKTGIFCWISLDLLDRFSQSLYHMRLESALGADDKSGPYFPIWHGTLPWQRNNVAKMKANWYYVHSLHAHAGARA